MSIIRNYVNNEALRLGNSFTMNNFAKAFTVLLFGLITRFVVNTLFNTNVFTEYDIGISIAYHVIFAAFVVRVHDVLFG